MALQWIGLGRDWIPTGLDWTGLASRGEGWIRPDWTGMSWIGLAVLDWFELDGTGLQLCYLLCP